MVSLIVLDRHPAAGDDEHRLGADPRLVEVRLQHGHPAEPGPGADDVAAAVVVGGAGIAIGDHPFGLDNEKARDMFALTMRGMQQTLVVIFVLAVLAVTIGVVLGAVAGYYGRWVDARADADHRRHPRSSRSS